MYSEFLLKAQVVIHDNAPLTHPLQQLTADLHHSCNERTRMLAEVDDLRQRVELQERRLKEVEGEKLALDTQLSSATGQLRHAREKATESIRRYVFCGGVHVRTYVCAYVCKVYSSQRAVSATHQSECTYVCTYMHTSCNFHVVVCACSPLLRM